MHTVTAGGRIRDDFRDEKRTKIAKENTSQKNIKHRNSTQRAVGRELQASRSRSREEGDEGKKKEGGGEEERELWREGTKHTGDH